MLCFCAVAMIWLSSKVSSACKPETEFIRISPDGWSTACEFRATLHSTRRPRVQPVDPELYNYIKDFEPEATAENLGNTLNLREPCLRNLRIAETLLKEGVAAGLTLYDIAW